MITDYRDYCVICLKPMSDVHHCVYGTANRKVADTDGLTMPLCREHHEMMHNDKAMQMMSHIVGQLFYERNCCAAGYGVDAARESFRIRYGKSYL